MLPRVGVGVGVGVIVGGGGGGEARVNPTSNGVSECTRAEAILQRIQSILKTRSLLDKYYIHPDETVTGPSTNSVLSQY